MCIGWTQSSVQGSFRSSRSAASQPLCSRAFSSPVIFGISSHHILGGSNFKPTYDPDGLRRSKCNSFSMTADKVRALTGTRHVIRVETTFFSRNTGIHRYQWHFYNTSLPKLTICDARYSEYSKMVHTLAWTQVSQRSFPCTLTKAGFASI